MTTTGVDELCINTMRFLAVDAVERAKSGHPGTPMGAAPMAYTLWDRFLKHNPKDPTWPNRDRGSYYRRGMLRPCCTRSSI